MLDLKHPHGAAKESELAWYSAFLVIVLQVNRFICPRDVRQLHFPLRVACLQAWPRLCLTLRRTCDRPVELRREWKRGRLHVASLCCMSRICTSQPLAGVPIRLCTGSGKQLGSGNGCSSLLGRVSDERPPDVGYVGADAVEVPLVAAGLVALTALPHSPAAVPGRCRCRTCRPQCCCHFRPSLRSPRA